MTSPDISADTTAPPNRRLPVSVVIPCYRCRDTIERALASIEAQTQQPLEVLLVDDCSGDGTLELLHELSRRHERLETFHKSLETFHESLETFHDSDWIRVIALPGNVGPASARNIGWDMAAGEFIAFLDADDHWHPQKLQWQYRHMQQHPQTALCGHALARTSAETDQEIGEVSMRPISARQLLFGNPIAPTSAMLRKELPLRFREGHRHMEDHLLWMEIALRDYSVTCLGARLAYQHKAPFGQGGLSAQLWSMERADLNNYLLLHQSGKLHIPWLLVLWLWSLIKFARRLVIACVPFLLAKQMPR